MKFFRKLIFLWLLSPFAAVAQDCFDFADCAPRQILDRCFDQSINGCVDWNEGAVYAIGVGVPNEDLKSEAQRNYSARRAAEIVARRNLLEIVQGVNIDSESTVEIGVLTSERIRTRLKGSLRNVQTVGKPVLSDDGSVKVIARFYLKSLGWMLNQRRRAAAKGRTSASPRQSSAEAREPAPQTSTAAPQTSTAAPQTSNSEEIYTGLIIDAREFDVAPALSPRILDEKGDEVYGSASVERKFSLSYGIVAYAKEVEAAKENDRVKGNPLVVVPVKSTGKNLADLVVNSADAENLKTLYKSQSFLREARVMIVVQ